MDIGSIFKAYDVRGIYGQELTDDVAYKAARGFARLIQSENEGEHITIGLGRDMRISSPALHEAILRGLVEEDVDVVDFGIVSTPAFYFGVAKNDLAGGVMITASHNPGEYNGIKMVRGGVKPVGADSGLLTIRDMVLADVELSVSPDADASRGTVTTRDDVVSGDVDFAFEFCGIEEKNDNQIKPFKVVLDAANAMGATYLEETFKRLNCEVVPLNMELDGTFPAHEADPFNPENNEQISAKIIEVGADLGVATDGDGDRIFFFDNTGKMIDPAIVRGLMAIIMLEEHPGEKICYDIRPGRITHDMIVEAGGRPIVTRVGHSFIKEVAIAEEAIFAGESSGHFFAKTKYGTFETPVIVLLKLLQYFSRSEESVEAQVNPYRKYFHSGEINSTVADKDEVMQRIKDTYASAAKNVDEMDGITIEYDDYWFNVRGSNTEPKLRLNLEAVSAEICKQKTDEILAVIRQ